MITAPLGSPGRQVKLQTEGPLAVVSLVARSSPVLCHDVSPGSGALAPFNRPWFLTPPVARASLFRGISTSLVVWFGFVRISKLATQWTAAVGLFGIDGNLHVRERPHSSCRSS